MWPQRNELIDKFLTYRYFRKIILINLMCTYNCSILHLIVKTFEDIFILNMQSYFKWIKRTENLSS
jgi:hypothetical protein